MHILLVGSGAREDALAWKFSQSNYFERNPSQKLYIWPSRFSYNGNVQSLPVSTDASLEELAKISSEMKIGLAVCGPEKYLAMGMREIFQEKNIRVFGPDKVAAQLEASKSFAKDIMSAANIPTARFHVTKSIEECKQVANNYLDTFGKVVLKADGLAAGKGVFVCVSKVELEHALHALESESLKKAAQSIVVEEFLEGRECSYFSLLNLTENITLGFAVDFKRLEEGDKGPNTGGMGCYTPVPWLPMDAAEIVEKSIVLPLQQELKKREINYEGFFYIGLMWSNTGPKVVEFNVRLGDPEAQILAMHDTNDWLSIILSQVNQTPIKYSSTVHKNTNTMKTVGIVVASKNYPNSDPNTGIKKDLIPFECLNSSGGTIVFNGALEHVKGQFIPGSGRVLTVVSQESDFSQARNIALGKCHQIAQYWKGCKWRNDIARLVSHEELVGK